MNRIITIICCLLLGSVLVLDAQPLTRPTPERSIKAGDDAYERADFMNALEAYMEAYEQTEDRALLYKIGVSQYQVRDYKRAERTFNKLLRRDAEKYKDTDAFFIYGRVLKMVGKYPEAMVALEQFIKDSSDAGLKELAKVELEGAKFAKELPPRPDVVVEPAGKNVNTKLAQYSPSMMDEKTLYYSGFEGDEIVTVTPDSEDYQSKIYSSVKSDKGWGKPQVADEKINRPGFFNSNVHISGDRMYFTRALLDESSNLKSSKIMFSRSVQDGWAGPEEVVGVNGEYLATQPTTGELFGKEVMFFVSDMDGGYGGMDLYYATLKGDGIYGDPVNLGPKINTPADDKTPFYRDGTLYYSTTGLPGLGGYDIFETAWNGTTWSEPKNMGNSFNSSVDDLYFMIDDEGYNGFLVSNRTGNRSAMSKTCCNDIFTVEIAKITAELVVGTFTKDKQPLIGATVSLADLSGEDGAKPFQQTNKETNAFGFPLAAEKSYTIVAKHPGYYPDSVELNTVGLKDSKAFEHRFYLRPLPPPEPEYDTISIEEAIVLNNILYEFNKARILPASEPDLELVLELMSRYPDMQIELGSHTDARGQDSYNEQLSQRRADAARRWLVNREVTRARIETKGYGETAPKAVSQSQAAEYDYLKEGDILTEEYINALESEEQQEVAHQLNRRTEFKIIAGPTSITIKRTRLKKQEKKVNPNVKEEKKVTPQRKNRRSSGRRSGGPNAPQFEQQNPIKIHKLSSLYGKKNLKGVPVMQFDERIVDLGTVKKGEKRAHTYTFTNMGDTPLEIDVLDVCECTQAEWTRSAVAPGKTGTIDIIFDSEEKDAAETIDVNIYLKNEDPENGLQIFETLQYKFDLTAE